MICYFVRESIDFKNLDSVGLGHICETPSAFVKRQLVSGPFGYGWSIGSTETIGEPRIGYYPARQRVQDFGKFAIALDTESEFKPDCLLRKNAISSHPWQDWSGNTWQIPIAQRWIDTQGNPNLVNNLPQFLSVNEHGDWVYGGVLPRHEKLWKLAMDFHSERVRAIEEATGDTVRFSLPGLDDIANVVFAANYRVGKYELGFLKVLLESSNYEIMKLVTDEPGFAELQKKTA